MIKVDKAKAVAKIFDLIIGDIFWINSKNEIKTLKDAMGKVNCNSENGIDFSKLEQSDLYGAYNTMKIKSQDFINLKNPDSSKKELSRELKTMIFREVENIISGVNSTTNIKTA